METRFLFHAADREIRKAKKVVLVSHESPDADTLGAAAAMLAYCECLGIPAVGFCVDGVPEQFMTMRGTEGFTDDYAVFEDPNVEVVAVFDAGSLKRAGIDESIASMSKRPVILDFDHHYDNELFGDVNVVDLEVSSTAELVYRFLTEVGAEVTPHMATCLLTGLHFDTGAFTYGMSAKGALETASNLVRHGGKMHEVHRRLVRNKPLPALKLWGKALDRLKMNDRLGLATTALFTDDVVEGGEYIEGVSNFLSRNLDCRAILVLKEIGDDKVRGSFRSIGEVDVLAPAKYLGGGGHKKAAGFTISGRIVETENGWAVK